MSKNKAAKAINKKPRKKGWFLTLMLKSIIIMVFGVAIFFKGMTRIEAANALIGSTATPLTQSTTTGTGAFFGTGDEDADSSAISSGEQAESSEESADSQYKYISPNLLDAKTATDLAAWYLTQFPADKAHNEDALKEFDEWYTQKIASDKDFDANYQAALKNFEAHPELLAPVVEEPTDTKKDSATTDATSKTDSSTTPSTQSSTPAAATPASPASTPSPSATTTPTSTNSVKAELDTMTSSDVANWVFREFPPDSNNWDQDKLADYKAWLAAKSKTDKNFVTEVNSFLSLMGWNG